jgi:predicted O-methyltransferase YrrM
MSWHIPVKTPHMKKESNHAPSMRYAENIYKVASRLNNFTALEIGAAWGFSALAILEAGAKSLMSVDPNVMAEASNEAKVNGYGDKHIWNCVHSRIYWEENDATYDLIYVDGSHIYNEVSNDLYKAWEYLNPGGLLLIDDWDHKKNVQAENDTSEYGVSLACWEFWRDHSDVKDVGIEGRVLWFRK